MSVEVFSNMLGQTINSIDGRLGDKEMEFVAQDGKKFKFLHYQDCCERVQIEDITGDLNDLIGSPILQAEQVDNIPLSPENEEMDGNFTWTFYRYATIKGSVVVRWLGTSNGYYSERVSYEEE